MSQPLIFLALLSFGALLGLIDRLLGLVRGRIGIVGVVLTDILLGILAFGAPLFFAALFSDGVIRLYFVLALLFGFLPARFVPLPKTKKPKKHGARKKKELTKTAE